MNKTTACILFVVTLVIGLAFGYGGALFGLAGAGKVRNARLQVGDVAPDFRLPDHTGGYVRLSDYRGESNVVIAFYRFIHIYDLNELPDNEELFEALREINR